MKVHSLLRKLMSNDNADIWDGENMYHGIAAVTTLNSPKNLEENRV